MLDGPEHTILNPLKIKLIPSFVRSFLELGARILFSRCGESDEAQAPSRKESGLRLFQQTWNGAKKQEQLQCLLSWQTQPLQGSCEFLLL